MGNCATRREASNILQKNVDGAGKGNLEEYVTKGELVTAGSDTTYLSKYISNTELVDINDIKKKTVIEFPIWFKVKLVGNAAYFKDNNRVNLNYFFQVQFVGNNAQRYGSSFGEDNNVVITPSSNYTYEVLIRVIFNANPSVVTKFIGMNVPYINISVLSPNQYNKVSGAFTVMHKSSNIISPTNVSFNGALTTSLGGSVDLTKDNQDYPVQLIAQLNALSN